MTLIGYQFDRAKVSAMKDASFLSTLRGDFSGVLGNRGNGMAVSTSGLSVTVATGQAVIQGRLVEITAPETLEVPANTSGYLSITIDLSKLNEATGTPGASDYVFINNQLEIEFVETLTTQNLHNGGLLYTLNLGTVSSNSSVATYTKNTAAYDTRGHFSAGVATKGIDFVDNANNPIASITNSDAQRLKKELATVNLTLRSGLAVAEGATPKLIIEQLPNGWSRVTAYGRIQKSDQSNIVTTSLELFTIPAGYRYDPTIYSNQLFYTGSSHNSELGGGVRLVVATTGVVTAYPPVTSKTTNGAGRYVTIDGLSYYAKI